MVGVALLHMAHFGALTREASDCLGHAFMVKVESPKEETQNMKFLLNYLQHKLTKNFQIVAFLTLHWPKHIADGQAQQQQSRKVTLSCRVGERGSDSLRNDNLKPWIRF